MYSARYGGDACHSDADRVDLLLRNLEGIPWERRIARFRCFTAIAAPRRHRRHRRRFHRRGDTIRTDGANTALAMTRCFHLPSYAKSMAELPLSEQKNRISHRADAARKARKILEHAMITDLFGRSLRDLRISVTDRCNFRCPYCMPAEIFGEAYQFLPKDEILTFEEIARLAELFVQLGVNKLRITGGEPLLRVDLPTLIGQLAAIPGADDITLTTNGYLLGQQAQQLSDAGLSRITVSLDTLDDEIFKQMNGRGFGTRRVLDGIKRAGDAGLTPVKINAVVQKGVNDHTIVDLARRFKGTGHIVRFIEYMDVGNRNGWKLDEVVPASEIVARIDAEMPLEPADANYVGEVARRWRYRDGDGEIGVIASVTQPFCADCTRARLSTDGRLYTCLFATDGVDLRGPMRDGATDAELLEVVKGIWRVRQDRYSEIRAEITASESGDARPKVEMYQIGG